MWDPIWEDIFKKQEWGKYPAESLIRFVAQRFYAGCRNTTRILEIGCGTGANLWYLARENIAAYGIDGSPTAIEKAQKRLGEDRLKVDLRVGDIVSLPYEDDYFDSVIDAECLYCNSKVNTDKALKEIWRVLKNGGMLYSRTFGKNMCIGNRQRILGNGQYRDIDAGPLAGKGFVRLSDRKTITKMYGNYFEMLSIDKSEYTINNGAMRISEWIVIAKKERCAEKK